MKRSSIPIPILFLVYVILLILLLECSHVGSQSKTATSSTYCDRLIHREHYETFTMKMGLCRPNITVICSSKPLHACYKNLTNFKATAYVKGQHGQCLIEANVTEQRTLQFYIEARRIHNPNQEGSRSLDGGSGSERHQKGKCVLKYICHHRALMSISMDCGTVFVTQNGDYYNFTKQRKYWRAPHHDFKDYVFFSSKVAVTEDTREVDVSSTRIFAHGEKEKDIEEADDDDLPNVPIPQAATNSYPAKKGTKLLNVVGLGHHKS